MSELLHLKKITNELELTFEGILIKSFLKWNWNQVSRLLTQCLQLVRAKSVHLNCDVLAFPFPTWSLGRKGIYLNRIYGIFFYNLKVALSVTQLNCK